MLTSYFAKIKKLPPGSVPIAICAKPPEGYNGLHYKKLAPKYDDFMEFKQTNNAKVFEQKYKEHTLSNLDFRSVATELHQLAGPAAKEVVLVCYEKDGVCHRHFVADWFKSNGVNCTEFV